MNFPLISFYCYKRILIWQKKLKVFWALYLNIFLNIIVNVNVFSDLEFEYCGEYYPEILLQVILKQETKIEGRDHGIFFEKITRP